MIVEMLVDFLTTTYLGWMPLVFVGGLFSTLLVAIVFTIRDYKFTQTNVFNTLSLGFCVSIFVAIVWPLSFIFLILYLIAGIIYYPAKYCRKFFW